MSSAARHYRDAHLVFKHMKVSGGWSYLEWACLGGGLWAVLLFGDILTQEDLQFQNGVFLIVLS